MENGSHRRRRFPLVNMEMIPAKITFFFTDGYFGSILPYLNVFYKSVGLSTTHAGFISGISLAVSSGFNPVWSSIADATGYRKLIFIILCLGTGSTVFSMPWIEQAVRRTEVNTTCSINATVNNTTPTTCHPTSYLANVNVLFSTMLGVNIVAWIFYTSLRCFIDGIVTNVAKVTKSNYGNQKVFSCLGFCLFSLLSGVISDHYHPRNMSHYTAVFFVFLPCVMLLMPFGYKLLDQCKWDDDGDADDKGTFSASSQWLSLLKQPDFIVFLMSVVVSGLVLNTFNCFFFVLMEHEMHSSKSLMGVSLAVAMLCEFVLLTVSSKIIKLLGGTVPSFTIGIFSWFPRHLVFSYTSNPYIALAFQPLHGIGFGLTWVAIVDHTYSIVPKDFKVTAVAIVSSIQFIATAAVANMVGGIIYDVYGGRLLFRYTGVMAGVWSVFLALYFGTKHYFGKPPLRSRSRIGGVPEATSQEVQFDHSQQL